jgi:hypothetical protein
MALVLFQASGPAATAQVSPSLALARGVFAAIGGDTSPLVLASGAVFHTPEGDFDGTTGPARFGETLDASFSHVAFVPHQATSTGNLVIISLTVTGVHSGTYRGLDATCKTFAVPAVVVLQVAEAQVISQFWATLPEAIRTQMEPDFEEITVITEQWIDYDDEQLLAQLQDPDRGHAGQRGGCDAHADAELPPASDLPISIAGNR